MAKFKPQYRRLLFIDRTIREGGYPNCSALGRAWEVSARTIQRDIDYLKYELEAPIEYDAVRHGFYYADPSWFLPSVMVSEGDLLALLIGQQALAVYRGTPMAGELERVYRKLAELLTDKIELGPELVQARFSFFNPPARPIDPEIWRTVLRGMLHGIELAVSYKAAGAREPKPHVLQPYHVVNAEGDWYLLARDEQWDDVGQYAMSRIRAATLTERRFAVPRSFRPGDAMANRYGRHLHVRGAKPVTVRLRIAPLLADYVSEKQWNPRQRLALQRDGSLLLSFPVPDLRDVEPWILSLGEHVKVLAPASLRASVRARHARAARG
jgi:proteasome accessory factor B